MIVDLPSSTVGAVTRRLSSLRDHVGAMALSRVLTLIVVTDERHAEAALAVAGEATRQHPSRIVCAVTGPRRGRSRLDGQIRVGGDAGASEIVVLRLRGELTEHAASVVMPLLLPDSPIVAWWPYAAPPDLCADPIGALAQRRVTDAQQARSPARALAARAATYRPGDTDLAWARVTTWRGVLAAAMDQPPLEPARAAVVTGGRDSASADLVAGWLAEALGCPVRRVRAASGAGLLSVRLERASGVVELARPEGGAAVLTWPGRPAQRVTLTARRDAECLAEELARLDGDEVYERALTAGRR